MNEKDKAVGIAAAELVHDILKAQTSLRIGDGVLRRAAAERGLTPEQLLAAAIVGALSERGLLAGSAKVRRMGTRR